MHNERNLLRNLKSLRDEIFLVLSTQAKERENQRRRKENSKQSLSSTTNYSYERNLRVSPTPEKSPVKSPPVSIYSIIDSGMSEVHLWLWFSTQENLWQRQKKLLFKENASQKKLKLNISVRIVLTAWANNQRNNNNNVLEFFEEAAVNFRTGCSKQHLIVFFLKCFVFECQIDSAWNAWNRSFWRWNWCLLGFFETNRFSKVRFNSAVRPPVDKAIRYWRNSRCCHRKVYYLQMPSKEPSKCCHNERNW